ncbi:HAMP domain-containing protein [Candidatus Sumerlaeota bacterium]|nr:HAMP domain-containing protein [Candidatus Sumerlaeota bacterium]
MKTQTSERGNRRRRYLVNSRTQLRIVGWIFLISIAVLATVAFGVIGYVFNICQTGVLSPMDESVYQSTGFRPCPVIIVITFWLLLTFLAWFAFRLTHRIAGPVHKFRSAAQSVAKGDYNIPVIRLRRKDELKELADDLNYMIDRLKQREKEKGENPEKTG